MGFAPTIAIVDFGENEIGQTVFFDSFKLAENIDKSASRLHFKNYKVGSDHIYIKNRPTALEEACIVIIDSLGKTSVAGVQVAGDFGWEYLPDIMSLSVDNLHILTNASVTLILESDAAELAWYISQDEGKTFKKIDGESAKTYAFIAGVGDNQNGCIYKCTSGAGDTLKTSGIFKLEIWDVIGIKKQPENVAANVGQSATLYVEALGKNLAYQWYVSADSVNWVLIDGATEARLVLNPALDDDGMLFRCEVSSPFASYVVLSKAARLSMGIDVEILEQPKAAVAMTYYETLPPTPVSFTCLAKSGMSLSAVWEVSKDKGATWDFAGVGTYSDTENGRMYTYEFTPEENLNTIDGSRLYRCSLLNNANVRTHSEVAPLYAHAGFAYIQQPANFSMDLDGSLTFSVKFVAFKDTSVKGVFHLEGNAKTFSCDVTNELGDGGFADEIKVTLPASALGGNFADILLFEGANAYFELTQTATYDSNNQVIHSAVGAPEGTSGKAILAILGEPKITNQIDEITIYSRIDGTLPDFTLEISASGAEELAYQWYYCPRGSTTFATIENATSHTYTETSNLRKLSGSKYKCVVSNRFGSATTDLIWLSIDPIKFTGFPTFTVLAYENETARFSVSASGRNLTYQWQVRYGEKPYKNIENANKSELEILNVDASLNKYFYRCLVSNEYNVVASTEMQLIVYDGLHINYVTKTPSVERGQRASFLVDVSGDFVKYQWQQLIEGSWTDIVG